MVRHMAGFKIALQIAICPLRAIWLVGLLGICLVVATLRLMVRCFIAYGALLVFSYVFLSAEWTQAIWRPAAELYEESGYFKAVIITSFLFCCLPILKFWPVKSSSEQEREIARLNDDLIAARQQAELRARIRSWPGFYACAPPVAVPENGAVLKD
jgi:hypothetical protein